MSKMFAPGLTVGGAVISSWVFFSTLLCRVIVSRAQPAFALVTSCLIAVRNPANIPGEELSTDLMSSQKLREPEAQRGRLPRDLPPQVRHTGIKDIVQSVTEVLMAEYSLNRADSYTFLHCLLGLMADRGADRTCTAVWRKATLYSMGFHMGRLLTSNWFCEIPENVRFKPARTPWGGSLGSITFGLDFIKLGLLLSQLSLRRTELIISGSQSVCLNGQIFG
ncbi:hypothetical protein EYF80_005078 [Liparis tanakae]|uniref:Uncharacterized protein n=1 Tax=Liparis tanakae TaxID=230148 RepID=A0A4Z2J579_9TELE|nr:hypothetical protein EYF80_005078 [Liparis tanakae]